MSRAYQIWSIHEENDLMSCLKSGHRLIDVTKKLKRSKGGVILRIGQLIMNDKYSAHKRLAELDDLNYGSDSEEEYGYTSDESDFDSEDELDFNS
ncbi:hypothetical protein GEMRC1_005541 [Eukaryota sp. GEM-RC1]